MAGQHKPEHVRQAWIHKFLERVVLEPCEVRGIDQANAAKASVGSRMMALGRGIASGTPDHWVIQGKEGGYPGRFVYTSVVAFEIKHKTKPTAAQVITADSLERCGVVVVRECMTIQDALNGLRRASIRLHGNTVNIAVEMQERMDQGLADLEARKTLPKRVPKGPRILYGKRVA